MRLLHKLFKRPLKPTKSQSNCSLAGPVTLHEAMAEVLPVAHGCDAKAGLTLITSGLDLQPDGRSRTWEFIFVLPRRDATMMLSLEPDDQAEDPDEAPTVLVQRINPLSPRDRERPFLPHPVRNSPEVVAALISQGVDFAAGPSDMKIESRFLDTGEAVWVTFYYDEAFTTRIAAADD